MRSGARSRSLLRHTAIAIVAIVAILLAADSVVWWLAGRKLEAAFAAWVQQRRAQGLAVAFGAERLTGWPRAAILRVEGFSLSGHAAALPGEVTWRVPELRLVFRLRPPWRLAIVPLGVEHGRALGGPELTLAASYLEARMPLRGEERLAIAGKDVRVGPATLAPRFVTIKALSLTATPEDVAVSGGRTEGHGRVRIEARGVDLAQGLFKGHPLQIAVLSADVALLGPPPRGPDWVRSLTSWRDAGGMIACREFSLVSGPLAIGGSARLGLDSLLQPTGQARARIVGFEAALDQLARSGVINDGEAAAAKAVLMLLARPSHEGGPPEVDVPIRLKDGTLSVGRIPLLRVPKVHWPVAAPRGGPQI